MAGYAGDISRKILKHWQCLGETVNQVTHVQLSVATHHHNSIVVGSPEGDRKDRYQHQPTMQCLCNAYEMLQNLGASGSLARPFQLHLSLLHHLRHRLLLSLTLRRHSRCLCRGTPESSNKEPQHTAATQTSYYISDCIVEYRPLLVYPSLSPSLPGHLAP